MTPIRHANRRVAAGCATLGLALFAARGLATADALRPWWDDFPRLVETTSAETARLYHASAAMNGVGGNPGWGLWFAGASAERPGQVARASVFTSNGIANIAYFEAFGTDAAPLCEIGSDPATKRPRPEHHYWSWAHRGTGAVVWAGSWTWFDPPASNAQPGRATDAAWFAAPWTRTHPDYAGPAMTYPDGRPATGFIDGRTDDPRANRVYDAGAAKDVLGRIAADIQYLGTAGRLRGLVEDYPSIGPLGERVGMVSIQRDAACPLWNGYARAATRLSVETGATGAWTDNLSAFDSFANRGPVFCAFGDWSVAGFRTHLTNAFPVARLIEWGVLPAGATAADIGSFDVRAAFRDRARRSFGWDGASLTHRAWSNHGWRDDPLWRAFCIFKRRTATATFEGYDRAVHEGAAEAGCRTYALAVNDVAAASFGWPRDCFDLASVEIGLGWRTFAGSRGLGLPPFGRVAPLCKTIREHGRSRFVNLWLYRDGHALALRRPAVLGAVYWEMLASHALPRMATSQGDFAGDQETDRAFFEFVARDAAPAFGGRVPVEDAGILYSSSSILLECLPGEPWNFDAQDHQFALWGWGTAMTEAHAQYRVLPEWRISPETLRALRVFVVPDAASIEPADAKTLDSWVRNEGGVLLVTGRSGTRLGESGNFDPAATPVLAPLTGVTDPARAPDAITNRLGRGAVIYIRDNLGRRYYDDNARGRARAFPLLAGWLAAADGMAGRPPALRAEKAPATLGLTLYEDPAAHRLFVDGNNTDVNSLGDRILPAPAFDVRLRRPLWWKGRTATVRIVTPDTAPGTPPVAVAGDEIAFTFPSVARYASVVISEAP